MTTGCLVRVTVTAAVYPCLVVSHHVDMQSTGQKSCCFSTLSGQRNALFQQNIGFPLPVPVRGQNSPWQRVFAFFPTIRKHLAKAFFRKSILQKHLAKHSPAKAFCKSIWQSISPQKHFAKALLRRFLVHLFFKRLNHFLYMIYTSQT